MSSLLPFNRLLSCAVIYLLLGMLAAADDLIAESQKVQGKPSFVVFMTDDLGQRDSGPYGGHNVGTKFIDQFASSGMVFTHAFCASPSCAPSRSAMLTGLMPARNGAEANHTFKRDSIVSLPAVLRQHGYQTAAFGKIAHGQDGTRHGFDVVEKRYTLEIVKEYLSKRDRSKPMCLFVGTNHPHVPWPASDGIDPNSVKLPPSFVDTAETRDFRTRYYSAIRRADQEFRAIYQASSEELGPNTMFAFTSDHGAQWPFGKWNLYDAGTRIPMIIHWPSRIKPGNTSDAMVQLIDLLPTMLDAAGVPAPADLDGRSFLPVLSNPASKHRDVIFTTHSGDGLMNVYPIRAIRTREWKLIANLHPEFAHTTHIDKALARDGGYYWLSWYQQAKSNPLAAGIVARYHTRPALELYHLTSDPHELTNLASDPKHATLVSDLKRQLDEWMTQQGDKQTVFNKPRLLSDPDSIKPGVNSHTDTPPTTNKKAKKKTKTTQA